MYRRTVLASAAALLAAPALVRAASETTVRAVPQADLAVLDPVWTTAYQTRDHALLVFDTLFGQDSALRPTLQMLDAAGAEADGLTWRLRLRERLRFHDGTPVLARDAVASIRRWGRRDGFGSALLAATDELSAADDRTIVFRLRRPFPLLPDALAKTAPSLCAIMPERLAQTDAFVQVSEMVGSGPYRFVANERVAGDRAVYARFDGYEPRGEGVAERTSGPKRAMFDRVELRIIQDAATAAAALQRGEVDWWLVANPDLVPVLRAKPDLRTQRQDRLGIIATMRFNQLHPPFDNPAIRRAILPALTQADYMTAIVGPDRALWRDGVGFFCPDTSLANRAGLDVLTAPRDLDAARRALAAAGYRGERVALLAPTDIPSTRAIADVSAEMFRAIGLNVDYQAMDWGTAVQRRVRREPPDRGGWSVYHTSWSGLDHLTPATNIFLRANGRDAAPGWPDSPELEALRDSWFAAPDLGAQTRAAERIQARAFVDLPYIPLGQQFNETAFVATLTGVVDGLPLFWSLRRTS